MKKAKATKRALLASILSMLLCVAMLIGSTFAWFTDSVTSGKNTIVAGTLDIELYAKKVVNGTATDEWIHVNEETNLFEKGSLWEPGHVEVITLKVVNVGTLALKYALGINIENEQGAVSVAHENGDEGAPFLLSDFIKYAVLDGEQTFTNRESALSAADAAGGKWISGVTGNDTPFAANGATRQSDGVLLPPPPKSTSVDPDGNPTTADESVEYVTLIVYMPKDVGNSANWDSEIEGNEAPWIDLGIKLFATQTPKENDSFGDNYDANITTAGTVDALKTALEAGGDFIVSNSIKMPGENTDDARTNVRKSTTMRLSDGSYLNFKDQIKDFGLDTAPNRHNYAALNIINNGDASEGSLVVNATEDAGINSTYYCFCVNDTSGTANLDDYDDASDAALVINGGHYSGEDVVYVFSGKVVINGGYFEASEGNVPTFLLNVYDKATNAVIFVKGGTFKGFDPADNTDTDNGFICVPDEYKSVNNGNGTFTVVPVEDADAND